MQWRKNGDLVSSTTDGNLFVLAPENGQERSTVALGIAVTSRIVVDAADSIYVGTPQDVRSYEPRTGGLRWTASLTGSFALGDGYIAVAPPGMTVAVISP